MSTLLDRKTRKGKDEEDPQPEITLSTASLLGLFLSLVLICGVFFGLGFSMGHRSNTVNANARDSATEPNAVEIPARPLAPNVQQLGNDTSSPETDDPSLPPPDDTSPPALPSAPTEADTSQAPQAAPITLPIVETTAEKSAETAPVKPVEKLETAQRLGVVSPLQAGVQAGGRAMVQIAAVGRREDADVLASALRQRGYGVVVRSEPQDKLLHVQVGPFATRAQANTMREKLLSDGYNAIIKQ